MIAQKSSIAAVVLIAGLGVALQAAADEDTPKAAIAVVQGTEASPDASAVIYFKPTAQGLAYSIKAKGLKPGKHAYHIHFYGDCSAADGSSAGTHFNLQGSSHQPPKNIDRITGDLGDLDVGKDGKASDKGLLKHGQLTGDKSIIGRSVIIHEKPNDHSQPPIGAAGDRDACGVIGIAKSDDD